MNEDRDRVSAVWALADYLSLLLAAGADVPIGSSVPECGVTRPAC